MKNDDFRMMYGWAEIEPSEPVVVGSLGTWTLTYHVGNYGIDDGGTIVVAFRTVTDWGTPQTEDPLSTNYISAKTTGHAQLRWRWDTKGYIRPWKKCLIVDVYGTALCPKDKVIITYGDTSQGSEGVVAQTFCEKTFEFKVAIDAFGTGQFIELAESPTVEVISGTASKLVLILPSQIEIEKPFAATIKAEDKWGNPSSSYTGVVRFECSDDLVGLPKSYTFTPEDRGAHRFEGLRCKSEGVYTIKGVDEGNKLISESNSLICKKQRTPSAYRKKQRMTSSYRQKVTEYFPYWGDLHGQSEETVGTNTVNDYFAYARDISTLDFSSHQGNDFQITKEIWREIQRQVKAYHEPHRFITFLGYEWSGNSPAGGDHNVYYLNDDEPIYRSSHWQIADKSDADTDRYPLNLLYDTLQSKDAMLIPHVGGRPANLDFHHPLVNSSRVASVPDRRKDGQGAPLPYPEHEPLEPLIEIYSAWGEFPWMIQDALQRGYKVGFVAGSDDHKGRPGASYPGSSTFGVYGGLVCVYAKELTREAIWEALKSRRCYATTGQRIILKVYSDGHWMGEEYQTDNPPKIEVNAIGTESIERVDIMRGLEIAYTYPPEQRRVDDTIRIVWSGAKLRGRGRIANWDGELQVENGKIIECRGYAFDSPVEVIIEQNERQVRWKSATAGDEDGIILKLDASEDAKIHFQTENAKFSVAVKEVQKAPVIVEAGGLMMKVVIENLPSGTGQKHIAFEFIDHDIQPGCTPYYVCLKQIDGAKAWSSPIYVNREA